MPLLIMAPQILTFWVGADFADQGSAALQGLTLFFALMAAVVTPFYILNGIGRPQWNTVLMLANGVALVALAWVLLPRFGLMGLVYARLLAWSLQGAIFVGFHRQAMAGRGWRTTAVFWAWLAVILLAGFAGAEWVAAWPQLPAVRLIALCCGLAGVGLALASVPMLVQRLRGTALR